MSEIVSVTSANIDDMRLEMITQISILLNMQIRSKIFSENTKELVSEMLSDIIRKLLMHTQDQELNKKEIQQLISYCERLRNSFDVLHREQHVNWTAFGTYMKNVIINFNNAAKLLADLNHELVTYSRQAGMSEVATSVLHNVGNVLNSANTSAGMIHELVHNSETDNLVKVCEMIKSNLNNPDYLVSDPKGRLIPAYLAGISETLLTNHEQINKEITGLIKHMQQIEEIVALQKGMSGGFVAVEKIYLNEVIDSALNATLASPERFGINLIKEYNYLTPMMIDKHRLLQILISMINNAKEFLDLKQDDEPKILKISTGKSKTSPDIEIIVKDNGIGIPPENLTKIFSMGFSTREGSRGVGLHASALAAIELGGTLTVNSEGVGMGAAFTLSLPEK